MKTIISISKAKARAFLSRKQFNAALRATRHNKAYKIQCISHWFDGADRPDATYEDSIFITIINGAPCMAAVYVEQHRLHVPGAWC